jgi:hypothetical protein
LLDYTGTWYRYVLKLSQIVYLSRVVLESGSNFFEFCIRVLLDLQKVLDSVPDLTLIFFFFYSANDLKVFFMAF